MEVLKNISLGVFHGFWDSIRNMTLLLHIDDEIHRLNAMKEEERKQKLLERQRRLRRSPSPVPSSAAALEREERERSETPSSIENNPDERSLESIRRKPKPIEKQEPKGEKKIAKQVLKCCLLNGGFTWLSIVLFEQLLLPVLKFLLTIIYGEHSDELHNVWGWVQPILSIIFGMMWVLPIFMLSKIVSSLWFADIANAAYRVRKGRPQLMQSISKMVADFFFSLVVQALFLVQSMLLNLLPMHYVGQILCFIHLCLLYSLYSFEYKWFNMGWELHKRLTYIENNWPYFLGFGIPLTFITSLSSSVIVSSCIFSIFFPLFILSGNEAKPLVGTTDTPLRLFAPVIFVSNLFFNRGRRPQPPPNATASSKVAQIQQKQMKQFQEQALLQQQMQQHHRRQQQAREQQRQLEQQQQQQQKQQFRYQQPPIPNQAHAPNLRTRSKTSSSPIRSNERGYYGGGMRPLIPTPVSGAGQIPKSAIVNDAATTTTIKTVRHR